MDRWIKRLTLWLRSGTRGLRLHRFWSGQEQISRAPDGFKEARSLGIIIELMTQTAHRNIDGAIVRFPVDPADTLHDLIATQDGSRLLEKEGQDLKFGRGEVDGDAVEPGHATSKIDREGIGADSFDW